MGEIRRAGQSTAERELAVQHQAFLSWAFRTLGWQRGQFRPFRVGASMASPETKAAAAIEEPEAGAVKEEAMPDSADGASREAPGKAATESNSGPQQDLKAADASEKKASESEARPVGHWLLSISRLELNRACS